LSEGRADVMLSNHVSAASIVLVSKVQNAIIEHMGPMILTSDIGTTKSDTLKVRVKMYLSEQGEELMPTV